MVVCYFGPNFGPGPFRRNVMSKNMSSSVIPEMSISSSMAVSMFSQLHLHPLLHGNNKISLSLQSQQKFHSPSKAISIIQCCSSSSNHSIKLRTCKNCKSQFDPSLNHPLACHFHTAHFGGETKRKFESVYEGGTMNTPDSGKVFQYWHCCGSEDPFHPGCTSAPHSSYDD